MVRTTFKIWLGQRSIDGENNVQYMVKTTFNIWLGQRSIDG